MAELLRKWLREDVGCDVRAESFEEVRRMLMLRNATRPLVPPARRDQRLRAMVCPQELASGYTLGRVMALLNMQPDFDKFDASGTPDARINNFTRLQASLSKLGIRLDSRAANSIMTEEKGVAARLLYTVKAKVDELQKNMAASRLSTRFATRTSVETRPSFAVLEKQAHRSAKEHYERSKAVMFEDIMRTKARGQWAHVSCMRVTHPTAEPSPLSTPIPRWAILRRSSRPSTWSDSSRRSSASTTRWSLAHAPTATRKRHSRGTSGPRGTA